MEIAEENEKNLKIKNIIVDYLQITLGIYDSSLQKVITNCFSGHDRKLLLKFLEKRHVSAINLLIKEYESQSKEENICSEISKLRIRPVPESVFGDLKIKDTNEPEKSIEFQEECILHKESNFSETVESKFEEIRDSLKKKKIVILQGNTGCGKTTKIPRLLLKEYENIVCTQPRRIAAISVAKRVSSEMKSKVGDKVGFAVRFEKCISENTKLKYVTDGILLKELVGGDCLKRKDQTKKSKKQYDLIIIDEAHERSVNIDILLGYLKKVLPSSSTHLLIMSATLEGSKLSSFFNCPIINIAHKVFPIIEKYLLNPPKNSLNASIETVVKIVTENKKGNILVFLPGKEQITKAAMICERIFSGLDITILKLYSAMPLIDQALVFKHYNRKIIFSTNIAETSITIDDISFVVDSGDFKTKKRIQGSSMDTLDLMPISKSQAKQRAGRAGRTAPGTVFRVYTKADYEKMDLNPTPEILRCDLSEVILSLKSMNIKNVIGFNYIDQPPEESIKNALECLFYIGALNKKGKITPKGHKLAMMPVPPLLGTVLIHATEIGCFEMASIIVSILQILPIFEDFPDTHPNFKEKQCAVNKFTHDCGAFFSFYNIYKTWKDSNFRKSFLKDNFLNVRAMEKARNILQQLESFFKRVKKDTSDNIESAFAAGLFMNAAIRDGDRYRTLYGDKECSMSPKDPLCKKRPKFVLFHELIFTGRAEMHCCIEIDESTLKKESKNFYIFE